VITLVLYNINLTQNSLQHSKTKHIVIRNHFIIYHVQKADCEIKFVKTENQLVDMFTKSTVCRKHNLTQVLIC